MREGLIAVLSIKHPWPGFESQTKVKLVTPEVEGIVSSITYEGLMTFSTKPRRREEDRRKGADRRARARGRAQGSRDGAQRRANRRGTARQARRLLGARSQPHRTVHRRRRLGRRVGKAGRDRRYQAILPIRGKIINVEKARLDKVLQNTEIQTMITAVGTGIGGGDQEGAFNISKLRYGRIIIMTDADVDGSHIRTLLLRSSTARCQSS